MSLLNIELQAILQDGSIKTLALANSATPHVTRTPAELALPLSIKAEAGTQYRLIDLTSGNHLKGQRLIRHQKNLRVFTEDSQALELQDYFVASLAPVENAPVYRLENQSCDEVQVISHYPAETFELPESNVWTEGDSALDCKVALLNPGSIAAFFPASTVVASGIGIAEISAAVIGIPLLLGGGDSGSTPTQPVTPPPPPPPTPPPPPPPSDTTAPTVTISSNVDSLKAGETAIITFTFSEDIGDSFNWDGTNGDLTVLGGTLSEISGSGLARTAIFTPTDNASGQTAKITVTDQSYQDIAGNKGAGNSSPDLAVDTHLPSIRSVQISHDVGGIDRHLNEGDTLFAAVIFDEPMTVQLAHGEPTLALVIGQQSVLASYVSGTGTATLLFKTTILAGQTDVDGVSIANNGLALNGARLLSASGNAAALSFDNNSLQPVFVVDTSAPDLVISSSQLTLKANETALITLTFNEAIDNASTQAFGINDLTVIGGTLSELNGLSGNGLIRTAVFTPTPQTANGLASFAVGPGSFQDLAGNRGLSIVSPTLAIDTLTPTVTITANAATLKSGETAVITFTFSEDPGSSFEWNGTTGDLTVSGGMLGAISGTGLIRTGTFTPTPSIANGTATITVHAASYQDPAGNQGLAGLSPSFSIDTQAPSIVSVALTGANGAVNQHLNAGDTLKATLTFDDIVVVNATTGSPTLALQIGSSTVQATYVSGSGTNALLFTTTILAGQTDTDGVSLALNALSLNGATLQDSAGNNTQNASLAVSSNSNYLVDTTPPTVAVTSNVTSLNANQTATMTFTFSEDPGSSFEWNGNVGDILVSNGTLSAISGTGLTRSAVLTPTANLQTDLSNVSVVANSYQDMAGNSGSSSSLSTLNIDTLAPRISNLSLTRATGSVASPSDAAVNLLNAGDTLSATVTFTEVVTMNTTLGSPTLALIIGNSTLQASYVSGSGTASLVFTTTITSGQTDANGVAIALNALSLNGATLQDSSGNSTVITSAAVNDNAAYLVDTTAPTLNISSNVSSLKVGETANIMFTFNEDPGSSFVWASNSGDVIVSGGALGNISGTGLTRTAVFTPLNNVDIGTASISVNANAYTDAAGNWGGAGSSPLISYSTSTPTVDRIDLIGATGTVDTLINASDVISATVFFSEAITLNNALGSPTLTLTIGNTPVQASYVSGSGSNVFVFSYTVVVGQNDADGVSIPASAISLNGATLNNAGGNPANLTTSSVADNILYPVDTAAPTVSITSSQSSLKTGETSLICFTFSEDPGTSFSASDITVTGGTLSALSGLGTVRRATFTPTANISSGLASITVADLSYTDLAGNLGNAGTSPVINIDTLSPNMTGVALSGSTGAVNNTLNTVDTVNASATFNDPVFLNTDGGLPTFSLTIGASTVYASYLSGSGTNTLVFSTTIVDGQTDLDGIAIPSNALLLNGATLSDVHGNSSNIDSIAVSSNANYLVDTTAPTVEITSNVSTLLAGSTANITFTFSEDPGSSFAWNGASGDVVVSNGSLGAISGTGLTRTAVFTPAINQGSGTASIRITGNSYQDTAGNDGEAGSILTLNLDTQAPSITSLALTQSTGGIVSASDSTINNLNAGDTISATVTFNDVFTVNTTGGSPTLALQVGGSILQATYVSGSGSNALVFVGTLTHGQNDSNGVAISANALTLNGSTLKDASGNNNIITSLAVADNGHYLVDTTRPTAAVSSSTSALNSGQTAIITFTFSEDPGTSFAWNGTLGDLVVTGGTLGALSSTGNPLTRTALLTPTSGVTAGTANVAIALNSYNDAAGNLGQEASAGVTDKSGNINVNTTDTVVASVALLSATGIQNSLLNAGDVVSVAVNFTEAVFLNANAGTPSLDITIGSTVVTALYASGSGSAQLVFNYTILNGQSDVNGIAINANSLSLNGKVLTNTAGNFPTLTFAAAADNANFLVDTTPPTLVSITSSRSAFLSGETATITFTFSEDPGNTFAWNGSAGDVTLVNGTLSALSGTGLTRNATFLPTQGVSAGNASITVSNNLYTDMAGNLGSGNTLGGLSINTTHATLMDVQISSATGLQNNALNAGDVVTVTAHFSEAQTLNTSLGSPTVALQIGGATVNATYASGAGTANLLFNYTIQAGQTDANGISIGANALALNGSTLLDPLNNATTLLAPGVADSSSYTVDTTAPFLSITSNAGQLKIGQTATITFTFSEDPGNTFVWDGTTGDVSLSNGTLSALSGTGTTRTAVFTPTPNLNATTASITVSSGAYQDAAGNNGGAGGPPSLTLDTLAPTISVVAISAATGMLNNYLNQTDTVRVNVTFSEVIDLNLTGGSPTLALLIGSSTVQASYVSGTGSNTLVFSTTIASGQNDVDGIAIPLNALSLNGAVVSDSASNVGSTSSAAVTNNSTYMVDTLAPSITLALNASSLKAGETATLTVTANDKTGTSFTWNGSAGDLTVTGGTLSAISSFVASGANYVSTATFTPTAGSNVSGVISAGLASYTDLAGNSGTVIPSVSVGIDTIVPTLTSMSITGASGIVSNTLNANDVVQLTAVFSEAVTVNTSGGTPKILLTVGSSADSAVYVSGSGTTDLLFNYTVAPGQNDSNGLSYVANALLLNGGTIKDNLGNVAVLTAIARTDNPAYKVDTTAPTVNITMSKNTLSSVDTSLVTLTFTEDPGTTFNWNGTAGDITVSGGTLSAISGSGLTRTATFTPAAATVLLNTSLSVLANSYSDVAGNLGSAATSPTFSIDTTTPRSNSLTASSPGVLNSRVNEGDVMTFTVAMDKNNMVLDTSGGLPTLAITIGSTVVQASYASNTTNNIKFNYTILAGQTDTDGITMNANGVSYNGSVYKDAYGNLASIAYSASTDANYLVDTTRPTLTITSSANAILVGQTANITFTFSEDIGTSFDTADIVVTNGTLSNFAGTGTLWTAVFTPTANLASGTASITVAAINYQDLAGNNGTAGITPVINVDTVAPTVTVTTSKSTFKAGDNATITFTFSEDPGTSFAWNGTTGDLNFSGGTLGAISGTGLTRTALYTPTANNNGNPVITVNAGSYQDALGNLGASGSAPLMVYDTRPPTVTASVESATLIAGQTTRVYFTFSEDPGTSFTWNGSAGDLLITGAGTLVPDTDPTHQVGVMRGFDFTPPANVNAGSSTINVKANSYQDTVGNSGAVSNTITISYDTLAPTVSITSSRALVGMGQTATITFTFSEDPGSTFAWNGTTGDVVVTQGTLGAISGTGLTRTAVFTPFADTPLTAASITVTAGSYNDTATNVGAAGATPTLNVNTFKNAIYLDDVAANIGGYAIESPNTSAYFGFAVSLAGDFNGDGYGDVVMGAPLNTFTDTALRTQGGGVVLYEGGQNTSLVPKGYSGTGQVNGHYYTYSVTKGWLGFSVAGVGDMNNDGLADLLIGMPQDAASSNPGGAFLVYGKANSTTGSLAEYQKDISALATTPDAMSITSTFDTAGFSVSSAGDVNGDGWSDIIISAHFQVVGSLVGNTGKTYVVYGSAALSALQTISLGNVGGTVPGFVISGWQAGEESGTSVSSAGDFNGDGKADLLVSAYFNDLGGSQAGATYVILGKTGNTAVDLTNIKNNTGGFVIVGENGQDMSGVSVSSGGDINGDGLGDILIGAVIGGTGNANPGSGKTYVIFGRTTANATIDLGQIAAGTGGFAILSTINDEQSGHSVSSAGDINGDGLADIILGGPYSPVGAQTSGGKSYVVYGKATNTNVNLSDVNNNIGGFAIIGQGAQDLSGYSVGAAGDINGDGLADLIVGAPGYDAAHGSVQTGRSYVIFGSKTGAFAAGTAVDNSGTSANDTFTSTGSQTLAGGSFSAGTGNDAFIANGADVLLGGMGNDIFTVNASMITALQNKFGLGGNTSQLAKIDGGAGIDTLRMGGTGGLGFDFSLVSNTSVGNIEGASRINSVERIDLRSDTASNQITLRVADVLDMAGSNWANLSASDTLGAGGWQNVGAGTSFSASGVKYHQVAIDGTSVDRVNTSGWTLQTTGTVRDANAVVYDVYLAASNAPAMMLVQQDMIRFSVP